MNGVERSQTTVSPEPQGRIVVRIVDGVGHHFPVRSLEWCFSFFLFGWGVICMLRPDLFYRSAAFSDILRTMPQSVWSSLCMFIGAGRVIALLVNGTFAGTLYSRFSPHVRAGFGILSCFFWFTISLSLISNEVTPGLAIYPVIMLFEIINVGRAMPEARLSDEAAKRGKSA